MVSEAGAAPATAESAYAVGWPAIDEMHAECDALLRTLAGADDGAVPAALDCLRLHLVDHFGLEEALMQASDYPKLDCHQREHQAVLRLVERVCELGAGGDLDTPRRLAAEFPRWLAVHAGSMDGALAAWLRELSRQDPASA